MKKRTKPDVSQMSMFAEFGATTGVMPVYRKISDARLPTNTTTASHSIHRWFNFIAGFSPEFVANACIDSHVGPQPALLLDPFAGCGTAPLEATIQGLDAIGYEAHPFFERICLGKLSEPSAMQRLDEIDTVILTGLDRQAPLHLLGDAQRIFLQKLFPSLVLEELLGARENLIASSLDKDPLAFLMLSKVLELSSHSATDGIYKAPTSRKRAVSPAEALSFVSEMVRSDLESRRETYSPQRNVRIYGKSSEEMAEVVDNSVSIVVTSPPYLNNFDFAEMTRMQLYFWGMAASWAEITEQVRSRLIVNTTTALKGHKHRQDEYRLELPNAVHAQLDEIVLELRVRRTQKSGKKEYDLLVYPYFAQLARVLRECFRVMYRNAPIHIMVADSALYGIHIEAPQILCSIMSEIGFKDVECKHVRQRGHRWILEKREGSARGLGEYHIRANR